MTIYLRKSVCGCCGKAVIADLDAEEITCSEACMVVPIPRWIIIDPWQKNRWLKQCGFNEITREEAARIRQHEKTEGREILDRSGSN